MGLLQYREACLGLCEEVQKNSFRLNPIMDGVFTQVEEKINPCQICYETVNNMLDSVNCFIDLVGDENEVELEYLGRLQAKLENWADELEYVETLLSNILVEK